MASQLVLTRNLSFYTIPAARMLALAPHIYSTALYESKSSLKFDVKCPRTFITKCEADQSIDSATKNKVIRATAAHSNGLENLGLFAAAVTAGNVAGLGNSVLNYLSLGYLASRVVYNYVYIHNDNPRLVKARTGTFMVGVSIIMTLFVMSGNKLRNAVTLNLV